MCLTEEWTWMAPLKKGRVWKYRGEMGALLMSWCCHLGLRSGHARGIAGAAHEERNSGEVLSVRKEPEGPEDSSGLCFNLKAWAAVVGRLRGRGSQDFPNKMLTELCNMFTICFSYVQRLNYSECLYPRSVQFWGRGKHQWTKQKRPCPCGIPTVVKDQTMSNSNHNMTHNKYNK